MEGRPPGDRECGRVTQRHPARTRYSNDHQQSVRRGRRVRAVRRGLGRHRCAVRPSGSAASRESAGSACRTAVDDAGLPQRPGTEGNHTPSCADHARSRGEAARGRPPTEPLLVKRNGQPWKRSNHARPFARVAKKAGLEEITIYALRHSNIVRQLLAGVPVRVVAVNHDTSIRMIERTYSRYIGDHADALTRAALLDTS